MQIEQFKKLHYLRKSLEGEQLEDFLRLESSLLDAIHRQRLYPHQEAPVLEQNAIWQKLRQIAHKDEHASFDSSATSLATIGTDFRHNSQNAFSLPSFVSPEVQNQSLLFPKLKVGFLTKHIPISYCYHHKKDTYPLIELHFDNRHLTNNYIADISVSFYEYSDPDECRVVIPAESEKLLFSLPLIRTKYMQEINEQCHVTLRVVIRYISPFSFLDTQTHIVDFLSRNAALLWRCDKDGSQIDCTPYLAAWVTPHQRIIKSLVSEVARRLPMGQRGYNVSGTKEERKLAVREQAEAVFHVIHDKGLIYGTSSAQILSEIDSRQKIQYIRFPSEVIEYGGAANCIDGVVLFASLLEAINLHPAILLLKGHAVVGWQIFKDECEYEFLDTVLIQEGDFQKAYQEGMRYYPSRIRSKILNRATFGYPALIDIASCRSKQILPLDI